jgi:hypothetical protein
MEASDEGHWIKLASDDVFSHIKIRAGKLWNSLPCNMRHYGRRYAGVGRRAILAKG